MGLALGLGKGLQYRRRVIKTEGGKYIAAATADGYSGGSATCAQEFFDALDAVATPGFAEAQAYIAAATANSFSGGSVLCSESFYSDLENISNVFFLINNNVWNDDGIWSDNANWIG